MGVIQAKERREGWGAAMDKEYHEQRRRGVKLLAMLGGTASGLRLGESNAFGE